MKKISLLVLLILSLGFNTSFADEGSDNDSMPSGKKMIMEKMKGEMKVLKEKKMAEIDANRGEMKENIMKFKEENGTPKEVFSNLTEEQKKAVKELKNTHKSEMEALKTEFKSAEKTDANVQAYREKVEALRLKHLNELETSVGDNTEAKTFVEKRKEVFEQNKALREENMKTRIEFRGERSDLIVKYKDAFSKRLVEKLPTLDADKLEGLLTRIQSNITKLEANTKIKTETKDKIIAQMTSLKELIDDELEARNSADATINLDEIIAD